MQHTETVYYFVSICGPGVTLKLFKYLQGSHKNVLFNCLQGKKIQLLSLTKLELISTALGSSTNTSNPFSSAISTDALTAFGATY